MAAKILLGPLVLTLAFVWTAASPDWPRFTDVTNRVGIQFRLISGGPEKKYIIEAMTGGIAVFDFDNDNFQDIYFVNGSTLELLNSSQPPSGKLYRNNSNGTFSDVTARSGIAPRGWCMGAAVGDVDNDGLDDLFVTGYGRNYLYRNEGDGRFTDVTQKAGLLGGGFSTSAAFGDFDNDGHLDLIVARYVQLDLRNLPEPGKWRLKCEYRAITVACGPRGLPGERDILYRNNGDATYTDVTEKAGIDADGYYGLGVVWFDYDLDGKLDLYVANDSNPSALYRNKGDGTFEDVAVASGVALSEDGREQAGMGVDAGDYDRDGQPDLFKTNFSDDAPNLYRNLGDGTYSEMTFQSGIGEVSRTFLGFGALFADVNNDGWLDILVANGHVYPQVDQYDLGIKYTERNFLFRNLKNGKFEESSRASGPGFLLEKVSRGLALIDYDNDGYWDCIFTNLDDSPTVLRNEGSRSNHWLAMELIGTRSNRNAFGAKIVVTVAGERQYAEVRANASYVSASDARPHFGLGSAKSVDRIEIAWPSGLRQTFEKIAGDRFYVLEEGGLLKEMQ